MVLFNPDMVGIGRFYLSQGICPKVNVIARLEYDLAYYDSSVQRCNHHTTRDNLLFYKDGFGITQEVEMS